MYLRNCSSIINDSTNYTSEEKLVKLGEIKEILINHLVAKENSVTRLFLGPLSHDEFAELQMVHNQVEDRAGKTLRPIRYVKYTLYIIRFYFTENVK